MIEIRFSEWPYPFVVYIGPKQADKNRRPGVNSPQSLARNARRMPRTVLQGSVFEPNVTEWMTGTMSQGWSA